MMLANMIMWGTLTRVQITDLDNYAWLGYESFMQWLLTYVCSLIFEPQPEFHSTRRVAVCEWAIFGFGFPPGLQGCRRTVATMPANCSATPHHLDVKRVLTLRRR